MQSCTNDFRRVDNAELEHVAIFFCLCVETELEVAAFADFARNNRTVNTSVFGDLAQRRFDRFAND